MYFYWFSSFFGSDKVWYSDKDFAYKIGDLISFQGNCFLCLGEEVSFFELYRSKVISLDGSEMLFPGFLSEKSVSFINWMVYYRYSSYRSVMRYFIFHDIDYALSKEVKRKKAKKIDEKLILDLKNIGFDISPVGQTLIVFPDLFTLFQVLPSEILNSEYTSLLISTDTQLQKAKKWWSIKNWNSNLIISTHSEVFQDYKNLKKVILFDPSKWYYTNQQDPRYKIKEVLDFLSWEWWISVESKWI